MLSCYIVAFLPPSEHSYFQVISQQPLSDTELTKLAGKFTRDTLHEFAVERLELGANQLDSLSKPDILIKWRNMNSSEGGARKVRFVRILVVIC